MNYPNNGECALISDSNDETSVGVVGDASSDDSDNTDFEALFNNYIGRNGKTSREEAEEFIKENMLKEKKEEEENKKTLYDALLTFQDFIQNCQTEEDEEKEKRKKYLEEVLNKMWEELEEKEPDGGRDGY